MGGFKTIELFVVPLFYINLAKRRGDCFNSIVKRSCAIIMAILSRNPHFYVFSTDILIGKFMF